MPMPMPSPQLATPGASPPGGGAMGTPPMGGTGAATSPRPMMGSAMQSMTLVHTALEALQKSLVGLPMGGELHTAVLKAVTDISRRLDDGSGDKAAQIQQLAQMGRSMQSNPQAEIMQKMGAQPGGAPQPPAMPGA